MSSAAQNKESAGTAKADAPAAAAGATGKDSKEDAAYLAEIAKWRGQRLAKLTDPTGWLSFWAMSFLVDGKDNAVAADEKARVKVPARIGTVGNFVYDKAAGKVGFEAAPGVAVSLVGAPTNDSKSAAAALADLKHDNQKGGPSVLLIGDGSVSLVVLQRGGEIAVRTRDRQNELLTGFKPLESFPIDRKYCVQATYEPFKAVKLVEHENVKGAIVKEEVPGLLKFRLDGKEYALEVIDEDEDTWWVIFKDQTSGKETYGMRSMALAKLKAPIAAGATVTVDFNKAFNPPCAFTPFTSCAMASKQNRLPVRIEAGEKMPAGH